MVTVISLALLALGGPEAELIASIRTAYAANRESLAKHGSMTFRFADGQVPARAVREPDDYRTLEWSRASVLRGFYAFDGPLARYDHVYPPDEIVRRRVKVGDGTWQSGISSYRSLTNGRVTLKDNVSVGRDDKTVLHTPYVKPGTELFYQFLDVPLSPGATAWGRYDLGLQLSQTGSHPGQWKVLSADAANLDGVEVLKLVLGGPPGVRLTYWVDLERGAIPRRILLVAPGNPWSWQQINEDLRWVGERGWLPFRSTTWEGPTGPESADSPIAVYQLTIEMAQFDRPPERASFRMEFPAPTKLVNNASYFGLDEARTVWSVDDLPKGAPRPQTASIPSTPAPPMPGPERNTTGRLLLLLGLIAVLLGLVVLIQRRRHD
jgi:hypothetical protein